MASKSSSSGKEKLIDDEEEVLQAVVLADSFNRRFRPLTTQRPRCLLPICNAPLLDWTFESLALAGVQEVFVVCRSHADLVKKAIADSKWSKPGSGMKIVPIMTAKSTYSPGDAMRDVYTRGLVTSDFVLVMGDLVSNVRIDEVVRVHKERRKTNKDAIMTMVVKESGSKHRTRNRVDSSVFVYDPDTSECLHYEHVQGYPATKEVHIPREILAGHAEIEIRNDLIDCGIDVCSVEVPSLFVDNFDYLDLRRDFVHGILTSDLLMKNIHLYVAKEGYAARVQDTRSYASVSKDILSRWTFPLVPDDNHPGGHIYEHTRGNRYIAKDNTVSLARTCNIGSNTLIGSSTQVSDNATIVASVIGQNCSIGPGTIINNSYIFENTVIGANCWIEQSIIGSRVKIKEGSRISKGCLIGDRVVIGPDAILEPFERLSTKREDTKQLESADAAEEKETVDDNENDGDNEEDDSDIEDVEDHQDSIDKTALGKDTNATVWPKGPPEAEEEEDLESPENWRNQQFMRLGDTTTEIDVSDAGSSTDDDESSSDEDNDTFNADHESLSGRSDSSLTPLDIVIPDGSNLMADAEFRIEVTQSLERAFAEEHSVDNAAVELKTLRMASNVPLARVKEAVVAAIVEKIPIVEGDPAAQNRQLGAVVKRWGELINKIGGRDAVETISILQAHCASSVRLPLFGKILASLYQLDIVEEDDIKEWHRSATSKGEGQKDDENFRKCWVIGSALLRQLEDQDDSDEDSEDDDGDDSDASTASADERKPVPVTPKGPAPLATQPQRVRIEDAHLSASDESSGMESEEEGPSKPPAKVKAAESADSSAAESEDEAPPPVLQTASQAKVKEATVADSAESSAAESEDEIPSAPAPAAKAKEAVVAESAESSAAESEDETPSVLPSAQQTPAKEAAVVDSAESSAAESEDEAPSIPPPAPVPAKAKEAVADSAESSAAESEDEGPSPSVLPTQPLKVQEKAKETPTIDTSLSSSVQSKVDDLATPRPKAQEPPAYFTAVLANLKEDTSLPALAPSTSKEPHQQHLAQLSTAPSVPQLARVAAGDSGNVSASEDSSAAESEGEDATASEYSSANPSTNVSEDESEEVESD